MLAGVGRVTATIDIFHIVETDRHCFHDQVARTSVVVHEQARER